MVLNDAQKELIKRIYKNTPTTVSDFSELLNEKDMTGRIQEMGAYIKDLENRGLINVPTGALQSGGRSHAIYQNSTRIIWFDKLSLTPEGYKLVES